MLINGIDPRTGRKSSSKASYIQEKTQVAQIMTFAQYTDIWKVFKFKKLGLDNIHKRQSTHTQTERYLHKDILPLLGKKRLDDINRSDVLNVQRKIERRGALSIAEKAIHFLQKFKVISYIVNRYTPHELEGKAAALFLYNPIKLLSFLKTIK